MTVNTEVPVPVSRFPYTMRMEAIKLALQHRLHLVRDNFHMWAVRPDGVHIHLCSAKNYDGLWRATVRTLRLTGFDPAVQPYMISETDSRVELYDPAKKKTFHIQKKNLRTGRKPLD